MKATEPRSKRLFPILALAAAAGLFVAGCSKGGSGEEGEVEANATSQSEVNVPLPSEPAAPAIRDAANSAAQASEPVTLNDIVSEEAQMQEDAEATGMTSRLPAGETDQQGTANQATEAPVAQ